MGAQPLLAKRSQGLRWIKTIKSLFFYLTNDTNMVSLTITLKEVIEDGCDNQIYAQAGGSLQRRLQ